MGLESTSWDWLRDGITKTVPEYSLLERVENGVSAGMADVNYVIRGVEGWMELKAVALPKREETPVLGRDGLNLAQINWHLARQRVNGRTWVFVTAKPYRWILSGIRAREINAMTRVELTKYARFVTEKPWSASDWGKFIRVLAG